MDDDHQLSDGEMQNLQDGIREELTRMGIPAKFVEYYAAKVNRGVSFNDIEFEFQGKKTSKASQREYFDSDESGSDGTDHSETQ